MDASADRPEFAPPRQDGMWRGFALALLAHALLLAGLTQGLKWQRESQNVAVEAELWSALPKEAAPPAPPPPPPPPPAPAPVPAPPPVVQAPPRPDPQVQRDAQIALERERHKRELQEQREAELQRERDERRKLEARKKREEELAKKKEQARLVAEAKQREEEKHRKEEEKKRKEQEAKEARETKRLAQLREENMRRMQGMAGTGAPSSTGTAAQSSGPSAGWAARVNAKVRPNIVFSDSVSGNPEAVVEVRLAPDGTIVSRRLKKPSGNKLWDEAVLRALDKTETLPRDTDGSVPRGGELVFKPKG